ncbi:Protein CBR-DEG-3 [Caenorhabditis briggsae]|uniref:Protein CBR-DEG-3 n=1 Tax=Caenorhabditis briggsae TaxID=6238 RepID=A8Y4H1_CAEBR|nr:Protein CBR-DEG-3 [Caenorhabditis briggsae]CAP39791.2 Protein CBR-DEG-3 [Caenorhabditis briggsae]
MTLNLTILIVLLTSVAANKTSHSLNATLKTFDPRLLNSTADRDIAMQNVPLIRLTRHLLSPERYDVRVRPILDHKKSLKVHISISLYQIIEVDEPSQNIKLNVWMIQKWKDEYLDWNPNEFGMITPPSFHSIISGFLTHTSTTALNIRFFPYDRQNCTLTISSWTNSKSALDYYADPQVSMQSFIPNEEWQVKSFEIHRHEYKYACCAEPWVILQASLVIQRKPLYYLVNLIIPTSIITLVAITGFFTPASTDDDRTEKINLGITTLLAMSILMLMVSDQMPTTSEFVPLIAWFYLSIIIIISIGTFLTSVVLSVQGRRQYGRNPPQFIRYIFFVILPQVLLLNVPPPLQTLWGELDDDPLNVRRRKKSQLLTRNIHNGSTKMQSPMSTLRVPPSAGSVSDKRQSFQMIDVTSPNSPNTARSRAPSLAPSTAKATMWEGTMSALAGTNTQLRRTSNVFNKEVDEMRRKRQCSLEWEFLATVLDRFLLIVFVGAVLIVTSGLILVGRMAQYSYDHPDDQFFHV